MVYTISSEAIRNRLQVQRGKIEKNRRLFSAEMPEWSNGSGLGPDSLVLT